jgi:hypothetical protein
MNTPKSIAYTLALVCVATVWSCGSENNGTGDGATHQSTQNGSTRQSTQLAPLPDTAFRASLNVASPPARMRPAEKQRIHVNVQNISQENWPALGAADARFAITLRNRWLTVDEKNVVNDIDGGASLPNDLPPNASADINISITAPATPGDYVLEFDMVQERVTWFRDKGSQPTRIKIKVE